VFREHVAKIQLFFGLEYENQVFLHKIWKFGIKALSLNRKIGKTETGENQRFTLFSQKRTGENLAVWEKVRTFAKLKNSQT